jgi:hypothetical protein
MNAASIGAPVGGLNDRDSIAAMPVGDAVILDNWWPYPSYVGIRKGSSPHVTGFAATVESLVEYLAPTGASTIFAAAGTAIYNATASGAVGAAVQSALTNARWQEAQITTPGGSFLYLVNGADAPRLWDGATWVAVTGVSAPAITGVTTTSLIHVCLFKNRLFFVEKDSMSLWYLPVNSVGGAASEIDMGSIFRMGGYVMSAYTWTIDAGNGSDDHFVIISSNGEVAVYRGTDPSAAATWAIVGVFTLGRPLGRRCGIKFGGDLALNTTEGIYSLGRGLLSSSVNRRVALSDKIQNSVSLAAETYGANYGWQLCLFPDANMLILNVPAGNDVNFQYCQNTITGAWARFTGWNASVWLNASGTLYYGDGNSVVNGWVGNLDDTTPITADMLPAFSYFSARAANKYFTMVKPYLQSTGNPSAVYGLNTDFSVSAPTGTLNYAPVAVMTWGSMVWGSMTWGGGLQPLTAWQTVGAVANSAALRLRVLNNGSDVRLTNTDYVFQKGGVL